MRNNPKAQRWEKSKTEVDCERRVCRSSQTPGWDRTDSGARFRPVLGSQLVPPAPCCVSLLPLDTPAAAEPQSELPVRGERRGTTTHPGEQVSTCNLASECNLALLNYPSWLNFVWDPPAAALGAHPGCPAFPRIISFRDEGK